MNSPASGSSRGNSIADSHADANMRHATLIAPMSNGSAFHILSAGINRTYPCNNNDNPVPQSIFDHDSLPQDAVGVDVGGGILRMGYGISRAGNHNRPSVTPTPSHPPCQHSLSTQTRPPHTLIPTPTPYTNISPGRFFSPERPEDTPLTRHKKRVQFGTVLEPLSLDR